MRSKIAEHKRDKKKLIPPLATIPNGVHSSWRDRRLPEMLWAALIMRIFPRPEALERIGRVLRSAIEIALKLGEDAKQGPLLVTLTGMALLAEDDRAALIAAATDDAAVRAALRPILLFETLPAKESWGKAIGKDPQESDYADLAEAVGNVYDHQSQGATDCRWMRVAFAVFSGRIVVPPETVQLLADYPKHSEEEMRTSRPPVRAIEISYASEWDGLNWAQQFWVDCFASTRCHPPAFDQERWVGRIDREQLVKDKESLNGINQRLTDHFWETCSGTNLDPRHEVAFGISLYAADLVTTAVLMSMGRAAQGRMTLRTLAESLITFSYLRKKAEPDLWAAFIQHGQGQAKLVSQRCEEAGRTPEYLDKDSLSQIANDDIWTEFLPVDLGHWGGGDLRKMAEFTGLKDIYDDYYTWPSSYVHGQWGAIRENALTLCLNPLHRFHRIPGLAPALLNDCREDFFRLLELIVGELHEIYPE